jgi:hypothetical protein
MLTDHPLQFARRALSGQVLINSLIDPKVHLLDCPHYTRPRECTGLEVPHVLLSGHHAEVARRRDGQMLASTSASRRGKKGAGGGISSVRQQDHALGHQCSDS